MNKIKTREVVKSIKHLDKTQVASERMKSAFARSKEQLHTQDETQNEYASNTVESAMETTAYQTVDTMSNSLGEARTKQSRPIDKKVDYTIQKVNATRDLAVTKKEITPLRDASKNIVSIEQPTQEIRSRVNYSEQSKITHEANHSSSRYQRSPSATKYKQSTRDMAKQNARKAKTKGFATSKQGLMPMRRTIKVKPNIRSAQTVTDASQKTYQAVKVTAQKTAEATKVITKATIAAIKALIADIKSLIAAVIAGGWVAVLIIVIICVAGLLAGSCLGIFFADGDGETLQAVIAEINIDYQTQIDGIKSSIIYDNVEISGSRASWSEILAIYAVAVTTDPDNATDVVTMDDARKIILEDLFWSMNEISYYTKTTTYTKIIVSDDEEGNWAEEEVEISQTTLYITIMHKTTDEMAQSYSFTDAEYEMLEELLSDEYQSLWSQVLYGSSSSDDIVAVALSQIGNIGGEPYWSWYGFTSRAEWCACFVSWCANECGYIDAGVIPLFASCSLQGVPWFQEQGQWQDRDYEPQAGDIIFFDWDNSGTADHVGIVEKYEDGIVYTIEGNSGDQCNQKQYPQGSILIAGYGTPLY